ncbi:hypothetical protein ACPV4S_00035 [Vibrio alginolyticus]|uniref:hypothetical protein n=1 Tax=Vibrio alginolyticus TaxID=663 RepID=UPI004068BA87
MSSIKPLSEILEALDAVIKIDYDYYELLRGYGVNENEAWIRAMTRYFLEIDASFESINIIREVIFDEYYLKVFKKHSDEFATHGLYLVENVEKETIQALKKLNMNYEVSYELFNSFSDEDLQAELDRREKAKSKESDVELDFDDGLDIEVQDLELKLLSDDDLDLDDLDFDDDDLDFDDDEETELKKDELSDFEVNEAESQNKGIDPRDDFISFDEYLKGLEQEKQDVKAELDDLKVDRNSLFLDYLDFEGMDSLIDDTECDDELLNDELSLDDDDEDLSVVSLFKVNGNSISFADYKEETVNDDILELIGSLSKDEIGTVYSIKVNGIDYYYSKYDTTALIHIFRCLRDLNPKSQYNTHISQIGENYKKSVLTMIKYLYYINEFYAENKQEPFRIVKKDMCETLSFGNNDWHNQIMNWLIKCGYIATKSYNRYVITDLGFNVINTDGLKVKYLEPWLRYRIDQN